MTDQELNQFIAMDPGGFLPSGVTSKFANTMGKIDPGVGILKNLFGDKSSWQPYEQGGQYYWTNPKQANPVPVTKVPGAKKKPSKQYKQAAANVQAITDLLPFYSQATAQADIERAKNEAMAQMDIARTTSGPYAQMMLELYNNYGPQLNAIGNEIARRNALAQAKTDLEVLQGPGTDLVKGAMDVAKITDPEFFKTRELTASRLGDLMNGIDITGALSATDTDEINKQLLRENMRAGTAFTPSQVNIASNAMRFGEKGFQRKQANQDALTKAIMASTSFLPASRTGFDPFQVATGRSGVPNQGDSKFTGVNKQDIGNSGVALGNQMFSGIQNLQTTQMQIDSQKKDWLDKMNQITSSMKDIGGMVGGIGGMAGFCWVAREVYGVDNPKWLQFREWLLTDAPNWLRNFYAKYGKKIASYISGKPLLKSIIRKAMDYAVSKKHNGI